MNIAPVAYDMHFTVPLVMFGWIPVVILIFSLLPVRQAVITAFLGAYLFLPTHSYVLEGLPDYDKMTATTIGVLLGTLWKDPKILNRYRFHVLDIPIILWCFTGLFASLDNDLGWYDGLSVVKKDIFTWAVPYFVGRIYFHDLRSIKELALGVFIAGLIYMPLCWVEMRLSPQLHKWVYGWHPSSFLQTIRGGGYRPTVFLNHGLMLALWMAFASVCGIILLKTKVIGSQFLKTRYHAGWFVAALVITTFMLRSTGASILLLMSIALIIATHFHRSRIYYFMLIAIPILYISLRATEKWDGVEFINFIDRFVSEQRADSLEFRLRNEDLLINKASEQPVFGWGRWGRSRIYDDEGNDISVTDGFWVIVYGTKGLTGVALFLLILLLPVLVFIMKYPPKTWYRNGVAITAALVLFLCVYVIDSLLNAMVNPMFMLVCGGVVGFLALRFPPLLYPIKTRYM